MNDEIILLRAIEQVRKAMSTLEHLDDEYIFEYINDKYQTLDDIQIELTNAVNSVRNGDFYAKEPRHR